MLKTLRDHIYRIRHYTLGDPLNKGKRLFYLWNYLKWLIAFKYRNRKFLIRLQNGYQSWVYPFPDHDAGEANIFTTNVDYHDNEFIRKIIKPGDFIVDAGCNVGNRTLVLADLISGALMIDANTKALERVRDNLRLNCMDERKYFLVQKAVGENCGTVYFTDRGGASTQNSVAQPEESSKAERSVEVQMTTIDEEVKTIGMMPSFIKIDVEGYDLAALKGAEKTLKSGTVRLVKFENNLKDAVGEFINFFSALSWEVFALNNKGIPVTDMNIMSSNPNLFAVPKELSQEIIKK